jgi:hypothetical protein
VILLLALLLSFAAVSPAAAQGPGEVIAAIRVHGNHTTPDSVILALADLEVGVPATDALLEGARARVAGSGRFADVEVRRRHASLEDPTQIMVVVMVRERAGVTDDHPHPGLGRRIRAAGMWMPVLTYEDGYGVSYGVRASVVDLFGPRTRVSAPLTWGADRRAAIEGERAFDRGPFARVLATASISRRVNPYDEIADTRAGLALRAEHALRPRLHVAGTMRHDEVFHEGEHGAVTGLGIEVVVDSRLDPSFPRNAVLAAAGGERLAIRGTFASTLWWMDAQGFVGLVGTSVLAVRARASRADQPLPRYERPLLGGAENLRGARPGIASGDSLAAVSAELRVPLTSPLSVGRMGVKAFVDAGTTWNVREALADQTFMTGTGGGVFFGMAAFTANLDVGRSGGNTRWHAGLNLAF